MHGAYLFSRSFRYFASTLLSSVVLLNAASLLAQELPALVNQTVSGPMSLTMTSTTPTQSLSLHLPFTDQAFRLGADPLAFGIPCDGEVVIQRSGELTQHYIDGHDIKISSGSLVCQSNGASVGSWHASGTVPYQDSEITFVTAAGKSSLSSSGGIVSASPMIELEGQIDEIVQESFSIRSPQASYGDDAMVFRMPDDSPVYSGGGGAGDTTIYCPSGLQKPASAARLDLLVLYTSPAREAACGAAGCSSKLLALEVSEQVYGLNQLLWSNGLNYEVRLGGMIEVPEPEGTAANGSFAALDLANNRFNGVLNLLKDTMSTGAGINALDWVNDSNYPQPLQPARDRFKADLVMLIASDDDSNSGTCGAGFTYNGSAGNGYSAVPYNCVRDAFELQHQLIRNLIPTISDSSGVLNPTPSARDCVLNATQVSQIAANIGSVANFRDGAGATTHIVPSPIDNAHFYAAPGMGYICDTISNGSAIHHQNCIGSAIGSSTDGDIILVQPNSDANADGRPDPYYEHLMLDRRNIQLIGDPLHPENVRISGTSYILPGEGGAIVMRIGTHCQASAGDISDTQCAPYSGWIQDTFASWPTPTISGFTIEGGGTGTTLGTVGQGVWCIGGSKPNLMNNIIENNVAGTGRGGAISWESCGGRIENNIIRNNTIRGHTDDFTDVGGTGFLRPNVSDYWFLSCGPSGSNPAIRTCWPMGKMDSKFYDVTPQSGRTFAYGGGAGINVRSSRYWEHEYPLDIGYAVTIKNNIIAGNKIATNLFGFASPTDATPTAAGAGIQLYGLPAKIINNTITGNGTVNTSVAPRVGVLPYVADGRSLTTAWTNTTEYDMTGFGIGCVGNGPQNSVIVNNVIFKNNPAANGLTSSLLTNYDCPTVSDQRRNLSDPVGLGNEAPDAELTNTSLPNIGVTSSLTLFTNSAAGDYSLKKCARSGTAGGYRDYGLMSTQHSGVSRFDMMGYLEKRDGNSPYNAFTGSSLKDPGAVEAQATGGTCSSTSNGIYRPGPGRVPAKNQP